MSEEIEDKTTIEICANIAEELELSVSELPPVMRELWEEKIENAEVSENVDVMMKLKNEISIFLDKRNKVDKEKFFENSLSQEIMNEAEVVIKEIIEKIKSGEYDFRGKGNSARVFADPKFNSFCFKIIKGEYLNSDEINNVMEEAEYLDRLTVLKVGNVRTPKPYYVLMDDVNDIHFLVMENLKAVSLEDFKEDNMNIPQDFNVEKAFDDLEQYLDKINDDYLINHNDIRDPNIMIDAENKSLYLIDFGKSLKRRNKKVDGATTKDVVALRKIKDNFLSYLKK